MKDLRFSQIVKNGRKEFKLSQEQLATLSGVSLATIRSIEQGSSYPNVKTLNKILKLFNLEITVKKIGE